MVQLASKDVANECAGSGEQTILVLRLAGRAGGVRVVHVTHHGGDGDPTILEALLDVGSGNSSGVVDRDTIIVGINGFNEIGVKLLVQESHVLMVHGQRGVLGDDGPTEVHVHQARGGELGVVVGESGCESALVMIIAVAGSIVLSAHVDDGVAGS